MQNNNFYGPLRGVTLESCKDTCLKDSVQHALHGGNEDEWLTSTNESFQGEPKSNEEKLKIQSRDTTNFVLGFDTCGAYLTTTQDYKNHDDYQYIKNEQHFDMDKSQIPDFCPEYLESRNTEPSEYQVSFKLDPPGKRTPIRTADERKKHTNDLRATHFQLGSFAEPTNSETSYSFCQVTKKKQPKMLGAAERTKSTVFRAGDWNRSDRKILPKSITGKDFIEPDFKPQKDERNFTVPTTFEHRSTHFKLGNDELNDSSYSKDFITVTGQNSSKPVLASPPSPALIIPNDTDTNFESTLQRNFKTTDCKDMLQRKHERKKNCMKNKCRQTENSVPISFRKETSKTVPQTLMSTTKCHFPKQSSKGPERETGFTDPYNHLTSDENEVRFSETKARYLDPPSSSKELRKECYRQFNYNISTHFDFGTDIPESVTEQNSQYRRHLPVDPSLRAAGKSLPQKKRYHHINGIGGRVIPGQITKQSDSNLDIQSTTVMKRDYKPVCNLHNTSMDVPIKTLKSHFFHMDNDFQETRNSTTKTDFLPPPEVN